jgi:hypothetical protein
MGEGVRTLLKYLIVYVIIVGVNVQRLHGTLSERRQ